MSVVTEGLKALGGNVSSVFLAENTSERNLALQQAAATALLEATHARSKWKPFNSTHEGYAVILEELDEAWEEIKRNDRERACNEMIQVAAMAIAFVAELRKHP